MQYKGEGISWANVTADGGRNISGAEEARLDKFQSL